MSTRNWFVVAASVALLATSLYAADAIKLEGVKCPLAGKPAKAGTEVDYKGGKVFFCCDNCPMKFDKDTKAFATKANAQLVQTEQAKQAFVSDRERRGDYAQVKAGTVGGFSHQVVIHSTRSRRIDLEVIGYLDASGDDETPAMSVEIVGNPTFRVDLSGDVLLSSGGVTSTSARMVNSIAALANAGGGTLLVGVADDGAVCGVTLGPESLRWFRQASWSAWAQLVGVRSTL